MHISPAGVRFIAGFEGFSSRPYWDAYGRVWTRGFGETEGIGPHSPSISRATGETRLRSLVESRYEYALRALGRSFSQDQWDALCSFAWNLGAGIFAGHLGSLLRAHEDRAFADAILAYDHAGGVVLLGLKRRREAERALFLHGGNPSDPLAPLLPIEREEVQRYDTLRAHNAWRHPFAIRTVRGRLVQQRKSIWLAARHGQPPGWNVRNRAARYRILLSRTR